MKNHRKSLFLRYDEFFKSYRGCFGNLLFSSSFMFDGTGRLQIVAEKEFIAPHVEIRMSENCYLVTA